MTTTPDVLTDDVADMAMGLILMTLRDLGAGERIVRAGRWGKTAQPLATQVTGKRLGIVAGRVGRAIAQRAQAFRMPVSYFGPREHRDSGYRFVPDLAVLARDSDVLVIAASADHGNVLVTADVLAALGPAIPDQCRTRQAGRRSRADSRTRRRHDRRRRPRRVRERAARAGRIARLDRVVVEPHRASATRETREEMGRIVLANLAACFAGQRPPTSVTR